MQYITYELDKVCYLILTFGRATNSTFLSSSGFPFEKPQKIHYSFVIRMFVIAINSYCPFFIYLLWYLKSNGLYTSLRSPTLYIINGGGTVLYGTRQKVFVPTRVVEFLCAYYVRRIFICF